MVIGLESSGYHSNGYSLIRKVFEGEYDQYRQWLLEPTRLYVEAALVLKKEFEIHAMAHMTGGGIENLPRVLPEHLKAVVQKWELPECFKEVQKRAQISDQQMRETFNCGMGLMLMIKATQAEAAVARLDQVGYKARVLGVVKSKNEGDAHVEWA